MEIACEQLQNFQARVRNLKDFQPLKNLLNDLPQLARLAIQRSLPYLHGMYLDALSVMGSSRDAVQFVNKVERFIRIVQNKKIKVHGQRHQEGIRVLKEVYSDLQNCEIQLAYTNSLSAQAVQNIISFQQTGNKLIRLAKAIQGLHHKLSIKIPGLGIELIEFMQRGSEPNELQATAIQRLLEYLRNKVEPEVIEALEHVQIIEIKGPARLSKLQQRKQEVQVRNCWPDIEIPYEGGSYRLDESKCVSPV